MKIKVNTGIEETSGEIIALRDFANLLKLNHLYEYRAANHVANGERQPSGAYSFGL